MADAMDGFMSEIVSIDGIIWLLASQSITDADW
jgi:hypothetical protein